MLVDHSTEVTAGDEVILTGHPVAEDLLVAVAERCGERGANVSIHVTSACIRRAYLRAIDEADSNESNVALASVEATDIYIAIRTQRVSRRVSSTALLTT